MKTSKLLFTALLLAPHFVASAAPPTTTKPKFDAQALTLMSKSARAYGALKGLSLQFAVVSQKSSQTINVSGTLDFARPGQAKITAKRGTKSSISLGEGQRIYLQVSPTTFQSAPMQGEKAIAIVIEQLPSTLSMLLPMLVQGENPLAKSDLSWSKVALLPDNCVALTLLVSPSDSLEARLYFDANDHLLRRFEAKIQTDGSRTTQITTLSNIQINPQFAPDTFAFKPGTAPKKAAAR